MLVEGSITERELLDREGKRVERTCLIAVNEIVFMVGACVLLVETQAVTNVIFKATCFTLLYCLVLRDDLSCYLCKHSSIALWLSSSSLAAASLLLLAVSLVKSSCHVFKAGNGIDLLD